MKKRKHDGLHQVVVDARLAAQEVSQQFADVSAYGTIDAASMDVAKLGAVYARDASLSAVIEAAAFDADAGVAVPALSESAADWPFSRLAFDHDIYSQSFLDAGEARRNLSSFVRHRIGAIKEWHAALISRLAMMGFALPPQLICIIMLRAKKPVCLDRFLFEGALAFRIKFGAHVLYPGVIVTAPIRRFLLKYVIVGDACEELRINGDDAGVDARCFGTAHLHMPCTSRAPNGHTPYEELLFDGTSGALQSTELLWETFNDRAAASNAQHLAKWREKTRCLPGENHQLSVFPSARQVLLVSWELLSGERQRDEQSCLVRVLRPSLEAIIRYDAMQQYQRSGASTVDWPALRAVLRERCKIYDVCVKAVLRLRTGGAAIYARDRESGDGVVIWQQVKDDKNARVLLHRVAMTMLDGVAKLSAVHVSCTYQQAPPLLLLLRARGPNELSALDDGGVCVNYLFTTSTPRTIVSVDDLLMAQPISGLLLRSVSSTPDMALNRVQLDAISSCSAVNDTGAAAAAVCVQRTVQAREEIDVDREIHRLLQYHGFDDPQLIMPERCVRYTDLVTERPPFLDNLHVLDRRLGLGLGRATRQYSTLVVLNAALGVGKTTAVMSGLKQLMRAGHRCVLWCAPREALVYDTLARILKEFEHDQSVCIIDYKCKEAVDTLRNVAAGERFCIYVTCIQSLFKLNGDDLFDVVVFDEANASVRDHAAPFADGARTLNDVARRRICRFARLILVLDADFNVLNCVLHPICDIVKGLRGSRAALPQFRVILLQANNVFVAVQRRRSIHVGNNWKHLVNLFCGEYRRSLDEGRVLHVAMFCAHQNLLAPLESYVREQLKDVGDTNLPHILSMSGNDSSSQKRARQTEFISQFNLVIYTTTCSVGVSWSGACGSPIFDFVLAVFSPFLTIYDSMQSIARARGVTDTYFCVLYAPPSINWHRRLRDELVRDTLGASTSALRGPEQMRMTPRNLIHYVRAHGLNQLAESTRAFIRDTVADQDAMVDDVDDCERIFPDSSLRDPAILTALEGCAHTDYVSKDGARYLACIFSALLDRHHTLLVAEHPRWHDADSKSARDLLTSASIECVPRHCLLANTRAEMSLLKRCGLCSLTPCQHDSARCLSAHPDAQPLAHEQLTTTLQFLAQITYDNDTHFYRFAVSLALASGANDADVFAAIDVLYNDFQLLHGGEHNQLVTANIRDDLTKSVYASLLLHYGLQAFGIDKGAFDARLLLGDRPASEPIELTRARADMRVLAPSAYVSRLLPVIRASHARRRSSPPRCRLDQALLLLLKKLNDDGRVRDASQMCAGAWQGDVRAQRRLIVTMVRAYFGRIADDVVAELRAAHRSPDAVLRAIFSPYSHRFARIMSTCSSWLRNGDGALSLRHFALHMSASASARQFIDRALVAFDWRAAWLEEGELIDEYIEQARARTADNDDALFDFVFTRQLPHDLVRVQRWKKRRARGAV